jgi:hypothetical protein
MGYACLVCADPNSTAKNNMPPFVDVMLPVDSKKEF